MGIFTLRQFQQPSNDSKWYFLRTIITIKLSANLLDFKVNAIQASIQLPSLNPINVDGASFADYDKKCGHGGVHTLRMLITRFGFLRK